MLSRFSGKLLSRVPTARFAAFSPLTHKLNFSTSTQTAAQVDKELSKNLENVGIKKSEDGRAIYLDMQATTPVDPRVLDYMLPFYTESFGNPHSNTHSYGRENKEIVEEARNHVAQLIGADPKEIIFTSGATESNNIALKGIARFSKKGSSGKNHIITTTTEHKCVLDSCRVLEQEGFNVTYLPVQQNGLINLDDLKNAITPQTMLVSVMAVNNEIGVIQPLKEIGQLCREKGIHFHTDGAQALGKIPLDVEDMKIDVMSLSGHKIYGPKGIGAIYIRRRPRVKIEAIQSGGGQERGIRSGTLPITLVAGFGKACQIAKEEFERDSKWVKYLYDRLYNGINKRITHVTLNGDPHQRYHGNLNMSFGYVEGESLVMGLKQVACSSGSACTSASLEPSYVLRSLGVEEDMAHCSIRFGIGRFTTEKEIDFTLSVLEEHVARLREISVLWELVQEV
eukprot:TRINITY_DN1687_c0_g1_i4.p1 TRINITY_DN1687_c0_g1~~TRINITY_DN1687_c0_g1_i4.p1  ORF type:complete len:453 (-),score=91.41 TRINITY_DN1687_c0_g1_i4:131-1489(-)